MNVVPHHEVDEQLIKRLDLPIVSIKSLLLLLAQAINCVDLFDAVLQVGQLRMLCASLVFFVDCGSAQVLQI